MKSLRYEHQRAVVAVLVAVWFCGFSPAEDSEHRKGWRSRIELVNGFELQGERSDWEHPPSDQTYEMAAAAADEIKAGSVPRRRTEANAETRQSFRYKLCSNGVLYQRSSLDDTGYGNVSFNSITQFVSKSRFEQLTVSKKGDARRSIDNPRDSRHGWMLGLVLGTSGADVNVHESLNAIEFGPVPDSEFVIARLRQGPLLHEWHLDPSKGYVTRKYQLFKKDALAISADLSDLKRIENVYIPFDVQSTQFNKLYGADDPFRKTQIHIDSALVDSTSALDGCGIVFPKGTRLTDRRTGAKGRVGEPKRVTDDELAKLGGQQ